MIQKMNNAAGAPMMVGVIFLAAMLVIGGAAFAFQGSVQF